MVVGAAMSSESSVGNEIPQRLGGVLTSFIEVQEFRKYCGAAECREYDFGSAEAAMGTAHLVEIEGQAFRGGVGDYADAVEGQVVLLGFFRYSGGFHFDGAC